MSFKKLLASLPVRPQDYEEPYERSSERSIGASLAIYDQNAADRESSERAAKRRRLLDIKRHVRRYEAGFNLEIGVARVPLSMVSWFRPPRARVEAIGNDDADLQDDALAPLELTGSASEDEGEWRFGGPEAIAARLTSIKEERNIEDDQILAPDTQIISESIKDDNLAVAPNSVPTFDVPIDSGVDNVDKADDYSNQATDPLDVTKAGAKPPSPEHLLSKVSLPVQDQPDSNSEQSAIPKGILKPPKAKYMELNFETNHKNPDRILQTSSSLHRPGNCNGLPKKRPSPVSRAGVSLASSLGEALRAERVVRKPHMPLNQLKRRLKPAAPLSRVSPKRADVLSSSPSKEEVKIAHPSTPVSIAKPAPVQQPMATECDRPAGQADLASTPFCTEQKGRYQNPCPPHQVAQVPISPPMSSSPAHSQLLGHGLQQMNVFLDHRLPIGTQPPGPLALPSPPTSSPLVLKNPLPSRPEPASPIKTDTDAMPAPPLPSTPKRAPLDPPSSISYSPLGPQDALFGGSPLGSLSGSVINTPRTPRVDKENRFQRRVRFFDEVDRENQGPEVDGVDREGGRKRMKYGGKEKGERSLIQHALAASGMEEEDWSGLLGF